MKLHCVYWILLFIITFASSWLLVLVAANGRVQEEEQLMGNVTIEDLGQVQAVLETEFPIVEDNEYRCSELPQESTQDNLQPNIFEKSLTPQPNLSQGISETGQAVVLTLVDTASAELQNLAEPRLPLSSSDAAPSKSAAGNLTTLSLGSRPLEETDSLSSSPGAIEQLNETDETPLEDGEKTDEATAEKVPRGEGEDGEEDEEEEELDGGRAEEAPAGVLEGMLENANHEDIPSFSEWAQKRLEEVEKKKTHPNVSIQNSGGPGGRNIGSLKVRSKNYASPDCGAKIVAANPEARSARSVLVSTRDEYMLNTCTSRVWFVVELCEAIQAKKIELANFELFSSSPKDLSVFVSDRFPTRDWSLVGQFTAQDERDVQSFNLQPHLFGKFIRIELHSHYGSEHFCPVSLFRAYGTSEFEVLETETEVKETLDKERRASRLERNPHDDTNAVNEDDEDDEDDDESRFDDDVELFRNTDNNDSSRNLFGSARDAVIRIVKKAAKVLVKTDNLSADNSTASQKKY